MLISVIAALDDHHEIALGNVIQVISLNTFNFLLCAIQPVKITKKSVNFDFRYLLIANIALILLLGVIPRFEGFMLFNAHNHTYVQVNYHIKPGSFTK